MTTRRAIAAFIIGGAISTSVTLWAAPAHAATWATVTRIVDGDTINARHAGHALKVRLLRIDTPELSHYGRPAECWAHEARVDLMHLLPVGVKVRLVADPRLDQKDRYGRLLRYPFTRSGLNVAAKLVAIGDANPYFYRHGHGRYDAKLIRARSNAIVNNAGAWQFCPGTDGDGPSTDVFHAWSTGPAPTPSP